MVVSGEGGQMLAAGLAVRLRRRPVLARREVVVPVCFK